VIAQSNVDWSSVCDVAQDLDKIGATRLRGEGELMASRRPPLPALILGRPLNGGEQFMIATMGPFWGALGLEAVSAASAWAAQNEAFGFMPDAGWTQVNKFLRDFYGERPLPATEHVIKVVRKLPSVITGNGHAA